MPMYVIYDRETGDVIHTHLSRGPIDLGEDIIEELVASERIGRAAFAEVDSDVPADESVNRNPASIRSFRLAGPDGTFGRSGPASGLRRAG